MVEGEVPHEDVVVSATEVAVEVIDSHAEMQVLYSTRADTV